MEVEEKLSKLHAKCISSPRINKAHLKTFLGMAQKIVRDDPTAVQHLMKNGLAEMLEDMYQKAVGAISDGLPGAEAMLDDVVDCVNNIGEIGGKEKLVMVEKFATKLLRIVLMDLCSFPSKLELLKMLNNLMEGCPGAGREYLQTCKEVPDLLHRLCGHLFTIGDYEFQVCIIEALFRFVTKSERPKAASTWFEGHLQLYPELMNVRDQYFETDCRTFLNILNSATPQRVVSCPCKSVFIGDFEVKKPDDPLYTQFLVDFNLGSHRITLFCNQEPTESQEEEGLWETVAISRDRIKSYKIDDSTDKVVHINLNIPGNQLINFGPRSLSNNMTLTFCNTYSVEDWMDAVCPKETVIKGNHRKVSVAINPTKLERANENCKNNDTEPESIPESQLSQTSVHNSQKKHDDHKFVHPKDYVPNSQMSMASQRSTGKKRKISVPCQLMRTPTKVMIDKSALSTSGQNPPSATSSDKPTKHKVKMSVSTFPLSRKAMELNHSKLSKESPQKAKENAPTTPKMPTSKEKTPKKVKTPLIMVSTHPPNKPVEKESAPSSSGRPTRLSERRCNGQSKVPNESCPKENAVGKMNGVKDVPDFGGSGDGVKSVQELQKGKVAASTADIEVIPESQPFTTDFNDERRTPLEKKKSMINDLKALLHQTDEDFADYPKLRPKLAESPGLSTVTEESCSKYSKSVTTPTNSQKTHLTSIPEMENDEVEDENLASKPNESSPVIQCQKSSLKAVKQGGLSHAMKPSKEIIHEDVDGNVGDGEGKNHPKEKRVPKNKRSTRSSQEMGKIDDSECVAVGERLSKTRGITVAEDVSRKSRTGKDDVRDEVKKNAVDGMDCEVSSSQPEELPKQKKKPAAEKSGKSQKQNDVKDMYNEFGFSSQSDEEDNENVAANSSQDNFEARIAKLSGKKVPEKVPKFFKARAKARLEYSQNDASQFEFEDRNGMAKEIKPIGGGKKGKGKKQQKPGMNFTNYLSFSKPREKNQSPMEKKDELVLFQFDEVEKPKRGQRKQRVKSNKAETAIEFPSERMKNNQRKARSPSIEGRMLLEQASPSKVISFHKKGGKSKTRPASPSKPSNAKKNKRTLRKTANDDDWEFPAPPSPTPVDGTSRRIKDTKPAPDPLSPDVDLNDAFNNTISKIKKKIRDATPKETVRDEVEEQPSQSQRSADYDLGSIRDDSSDEERTAALIHYDSKAKATMMDYDQQETEKESNLSLGNKKSLPVDVASDHDDVKELPKSKKQLDKKQKHVERESKKDKKATRPRAEELEEKRDTDLFEPEDGDADVDEVKQVSKPRSKPCDKKLMPTRRESTKGRRATRPSMIELDESENEDNLYDPSDDEDDVCALEVEEQVPRKSRIKPRDKRQKPMQKESMKGRRATRPKAEELQEQENDDVVYDPAYDEDDDDDDDVCDLDEVKQVPKRSRTNLCIKKQKPKQREKRQRKSTTRPKAGESQEPENDDDDVCDLDAVEQVPKRSRTKPCDKKQKPVLRESRKVDRANRPRKEELEEPENDVDVSDFVEVEQVPKSRAKPCGQTERCVQREKMKENRSARPGVEVLDENDACLYKHNNNLPSIDDDEVLENSRTKPLDKKHKPVQKNDKKERNARKSRVNEVEENENDRDVMEDADGFVEEQEFSSGLLANFAKKCQDLLSGGNSTKTSSTLTDENQGDRRRKKPVNYREISESESDLGSATSFETRSSKRANRKFNLYRPDEQDIYTPEDKVITSSHKKKRRNVFTDATDAKSEASWLVGTTARKNEKQRPARTYGPGKKPVKRGKLQPGHSVFYDEESDKENIPIGHNKRGKKAAVKKQVGKQHPNGRVPLSDSRETITPNLYQAEFPQESIYTPLEPLHIEADRPPSPKQAVVFKMKSPRYGRGKHYKPLEIAITPVTPRTAARMQEDDLSIEEFRSVPENDINYSIAHVSPVNMKIQESASPSSDGEDDSPEKIDVYSGTSRISHISNIKTPKTQPTRDTKADTSMIEVPELDFEDLSALPFAFPKSGPSSTLRQQKRGVKRSLPASDDEEEEDEEEDEEDEEETSQTTTVEEEEVKVSLYKPRKLFKTDDESDTGGDDVCSLSQSLPRSDNVGLQAIPAVIKSFGSEFQKKYQSRKEKLEHFSKTTLKSAHKQVERFWHTQQGTRQKMMDNFTGCILQDLNALEKDVDKLRNAENKSMEFLKCHLNTLEACRVSQEKRIENLKKTHLVFNNEQREFEMEQTGQQENVREILRKEIQAMQKKILMQSQKEEMMNVRRTLQMMFQ